MLDTYSCWGLKCSGSQKNKCSHLQKPWTKAINRFFPVVTLKKNGGITLESRVLTSSLLYVTVRKGSKIQELTVITGSATTAFWPVRWSILKHLLTCDLLSVSAGYARVVLALLAFYLMPCCPWPAVFCYLLSALLDSFDGHAARALNQCRHLQWLSWHWLFMPNGIPRTLSVLLCFLSATKFGAMLDMLTDRCATMCLLVNLSLLYPSYTFLFQLSMSLDIASHWLHLHRYAFPLQECWSSGSAGWFIY